MNKDLDRNELAAHISVEIFNFLGNNGCPGISTKDLAYCMMVVFDSIVARSVGLDKNPEEWWKASGECRDDVMSAFANLSNRAYYLGDNNSKVSDSKPDS